MKSANAALLRFTIATAVLNDEVSTFDVGYRKWISPIWDDEEKPRMNADEADQKRLLLGGIQSGADV